MNQKTPIWPNDAQILAAPEPEDNAPRDLVDDIRLAFVRHGWAEHLLDDAHLADTFESCLRRYDEMQTALNGMADTVNRLRDTIAGQPAAACARGVIGVHIANTTGEAAFPVRKET